jgi:AcrR family transcriptional regulator
VGVPAVPPSTKEQIVRTAERLFASHGLDGVSLRQIGAESGNGNNSAVQYHFGSKDQLVRAIFEYRLTHLQERRRTLVAARRPDDVRSWLECYVLPILEQGEQDGSHYLSFIAMLQQHARRELVDRIPSELLLPTATFRRALSNLLIEVPEPLRAYRITQVLIFSVHATADRERARVLGLAVLPFAVHVANLLDGLVGFLEAPVSRDALRARSIRSSRPRRSVPSARAARSAAGGIAAPAPARPPVL